MQFCISHKLYLFTGSKKLLFFHCYKKCHGLIIIIAIILQNLFLFLNSDAHACSSRTIHLWSSSRLRFLPFFLSSLCLSASSFLFQPLLPHRLPIPPGHANI